MPYCVAVFVPDTRDSLQRVVSPAEVVILDVRESSVVPKECSPVRVKFGQQAELKWSHTGSALLAHCTTDVDDTGQRGLRTTVVQSWSSSRRGLLLGPHRGERLGGAGCLLVSDQRRVCRLIQGFQPAKVTCWKWDAQARECSQTAVLQEKMHRNTIRWNHFGSMVCIAGFGNLAGKVDFFARSDNDLKKISSCEATCTVHADWAPDGRHLLTAVLAPRMRVDNGLSIWSALTGFKAAELAYDELLEAHWAPEPASSSRRVHGHHPRGAAEGGQRPGFGGSRSKRRVARQEAGIPSSECS
ncbi:unnamed protein product [Prorocentrum cordatum]|uniref:Translation initiation factor beta propellor-like domain-containing protein n=1 Tax=Prorocentrum cordatum TaxID=2364126 RepID=A0ABN9WXT4_9DINO|nr:unnamed protein product [Polarella glacialis]